MAPWDWGIVEATLVYTRGTEPEALTGAIERLIRGRFEVEATTAGPQSVVSPGTHPDQRLLW